MRAKFEWDGDEVRLTYGGETRTFRVSGEQEGYVVEMVDPTIPDRWRVCQRLEHQERHQRERPWCRLDDLLSVIRREWRKAREFANDNR